MSFPDKIIDFLIDEKKRMSTKAAFIFLGIIAVVLIDNVVGFSYHYKVDKELNQIQLLNQILKDSVTDFKTKYYVSALRRELIERKNVLEKSYDYCSNLEWQKTPDLKSETLKPKIKQQQVMRSRFWFNATSGGFFYLFAILMLPIMLFADRTTPFLERLATGIMAGAVFYGVGFFFYWVCNFIPQILSSNWILNYIVNILIQGSIIILMVKLNDKNK